MYNAYQHCSVAACDNSSIAMSGSCCTGGWCDSNAQVCYTDGGCKYAYSPFYTHTNDRRLSSSRKLFHSCNDEAFVACMASMTNISFDGGCESHGNESGCVTGYTKMYCNGSNFYYADGCDSCDETCVADDITSQTDGQAYCDADDPWTFYHVDEDGVLRNTSTLSGSNSSSCIWSDCSKSYSDSFSCEVGYWKAYCNGSHAYYVEGCEMCDENCVAMDMTIATSSQYYCDENDPYKAYYDVHGDGSEIQELEMFGTDPSMCKYDNCTGSYSFDYDDGKDKS